MNEIDFNKGSWLFRTTGEVEQISPERDNCFSLEEMQRYVNGLIQIVGSPIGGKEVYCNEEGLLYDLPVNMAYLLHFDQELRGNVLLLCEKQLSVG